MACQGWYELCVETGGGGFEAVTSPQMRSSGAPSGQGLVL